jgi:hypothetical protein
MPTLPAPICDTELLLKTGNQIKRWLRRFDVTGILVHRVDKKGALLQPPLPKSVGPFMHAIMDIENNVRLLLRAPYLPERIEWVEEALAKALTLKKNVDVEFFSEAGSLHKIVPLLADVRTALDFCTRSEPRSDDAGLRSLLAKLRQVEPQE